MQCLACYRDKRGIITHCRLSSNGVEKVFPKDEVKAMLRQKNKIDGLRLTSDNRLIQTDNKIALYVHEYSRAVTPQVRQAGNRLSGLAETAYASFTRVMFCLSHIPLALRCHEQHQCL